jgi:hypothetical protein
MAEIKIDAETIQQLVDRAVEQNILNAIEHLGKDPAWLEKIERMINQTVVQRTVATIGSIDINTVIHQRVDECMEKIGEQFLTNFSSTGIVDQATSCQFTIMDDVTVVENELTTKDLQVVGTTNINDLNVTGSINVDNPSWVNLAEHISNNTLEKLNNTWTKNLTDQVVSQIQEHGINFTKVKVDDELLVDGNRLSRGITETNIRSVGALKSLEVTGETHLNDTVSVVRGRLGINTKSPEMALSIWDEEVLILLGKGKSKQAYIGTSRDQSLALGVNRIPQLEINPDGLTTIKKLQVGVHRISHDTTVPGYQGTRGDIVFNSSPGNDRVFAWVCVGGYNWQTLKSAE